jgi:hypothetical protein
MEYEKDCATSFEKSLRARKNLMEKEGSYQVGYS